MKQSRKNQQYEARGAELFFNWGCACTLLFFWGGKPPKGVPFMSFSECNLLTIENKENAVLFQSDMFSLPDFGDSVR